MENVRTAFVTYRNSVRDINRAAREDPAAFVAETEAAYQRSLDVIARRIASQDPMCKLVMIAGPSSSGKTTTSHRLLASLQKFGVESVIISLDNFYFDEQNAPLLPDGTRDYESLAAIDLDDIRRCLLGLVRNNRCDMPLFDFEKHRPCPDRRRVELHGREVAVVEGIHALNPALTSHLPKLRAHRIYISVKQGVEDEGRQIFGPNDIRLIRRLVRDRNFRGTGPEQTLRMWGNVMNGERRYIKPFRPFADSTINSFHAYELCVLKRQALELLHTVPEQSVDFACAQKLMQGLGRVESIDPGLVPGNSIIREFIGGGTV